MKHSKLATLLFVTTAFIGSPAYANWDWNGATIVNILVEGEADGSRTYVHFDREYNPSGCSGGAYFVRTYANTQKGKHQYAMLLSAQIAGKKIARYISGCDDWGRPILDGIQIQ